MTELKPCPFCGGKAEFIDTDARYARQSCFVYFKIKCKKCLTEPQGAFGYIAFNLRANGEFNVWHDDRPDAIAKWNRRVENG